MHWVKRKWLNWLTYLSFLKKESENAKNNVRFSEDYRTNYERKMNSKKYEPPTLKKENKNHTENKDCKNEKNGKKEKKKNYKKFTTAQNNDKKSKNSSNESYPWLVWENNSCRVDSFLTLIVLSVINKFPKIMHCYPCEQNFVVISKLLIESTNKLNNAQYDAKTQFRECLNELGFDQIYNENLNCFSAFREWAPVTNMFNIFN